ncbi:MAG: DUF3017 domain-containing protein [Mycobacteriaceae bacterium]|nr:DUF3017 domain-containing protein [Mycobacteriaceae bacterium]
MRLMVRSQWAILLVGLIFAAAFGLVGTNYWRRGAVLIGIGVTVAAGLRLALSEERAGLLAVRHKGTDVAMLALVGAVMLYVSSTIDPLGTG